MNWLKTIAIFGVGAAAGFGAGWLYFKKKYEKIANDDIAEVKKYYLDKHLKEVSKVEELKKQSDVVDKEVKKVAEIVEKGPSRASQKVDYNNIQKREEQEMRAEAESPEEDEPTSPYIITEDEFLEGNNDYDKISLTYFMMDDTLADDSETLVDIEETISTDIFNQMADSDDDRDWYVRNNELQTDFEIMKVEGSFSDRMGYSY